jgi:hypothetical protein
LSVVVENVLRNQPGQISYALQTNLQQHDTSVYVRSKIFRQPGRINTILMAALRQKRDEQQSLTKLNTVCPLRHRGEAKHPRRGRVFQQAWIRWPTHPITVPRSQIEYADLEAEGFNRGDLRIICPDGTAVSGECIRASLGTDHITKSG